MEIDPVDFCHGLCVGDIICIEGEKDILVTKDVDLLSRQVEGLLVKSNELLLDINGKVATIDPLFTAVADLSESVSELNHSSKNIATKVGGIGKTTAKATVAGKVGGTAMKFFKNKKHTETTGGK